MQFLKYFILITGLLSCDLLYAQNELPTPAPSITVTIKSGSLIIPMDTTLQKIPGYFNLKAYGLVNYLLQNEVPVKWAIKGNKTKTVAANGVDFTANSNRVYPDTTISSSLSYRGGPFIIDSAWVTTALPFITAFEMANGNKIAVYKLNTNTSIDVRYTLTFKPKIALLNHNGYDTITVSVLNEAGYSSSNYALSLPANQIFNENLKYSLVSDGHYANGDTAHINPVLRFVNKGGNLIADCAAQGSYETALSMTTLGIDTVPVASGGSITAPAYPNHFLPIAQFDGILATPNGEYKYWFLKTGSAFRTNAYQLFRYTTTGLIPNVQVTVLAGAKVKPNAEKGGNLFYLGGHDYFFYGSPGSSNDNNRINGRRIFLNATLIPPSDTMLLDFTTDVALSMVASGFAVKNEVLCIDVIAKNITGGTAKNVKVQVNLPAGLSYSSHSCGLGLYNSGTGLWTIGSIAKGVFDTLHLFVNVNALGAMTINGSATNTAYETILPNNIATLNIFGVSRPVAVNDTTIFLGPYAVDMNTRSNDSDEDGGPFGNTSVLSGPFNGSATVIGTDTIRYVPSASYTGPDSLLYLTCDNYPLCDTGWLFINVQNPLPVELTLFTGKRINGTVNLNWTTLSEKENDFFAVERSSDGKSFEVRGQVKGFGTSVDVHHYTFNDPDNSSPMLYYRLKQYDWNGESHLSKTIALSRKNTGELALSLYPNPLNADHELIIQSQNIKGDAQLFIYDMTGRKIWSKVCFVEEGKSFEVIQTSTILQSGVYIVSLISDAETISTLLVVK